MAETRYQMLEVLSFLRPGECLTSLTKDNSANFSSENGKMKPFGESIF